MARQGRSFGELSRSYQNKLLLLMDEDDDMQLMERNPEHNGQGAERDELIVDPHAPVFDEIEDASDWDEFIPDEEELVLEEDGLVSDLEERVSDSILDERRDMEIDDNSAHDSISDGQAYSTSAQADEHDSEVFSEFSDESFNHSVNSDYSYHRHQLDDDLPLYEGASITKSESSIAILNFSLRHNITGAQLSDLLRLISVHCPPENQCKTTLYKFKKDFSHMQTPLIRHFYCTHCLRRVQNKDSICPRCNDHGKISYFIEVPIIPQLQALYRRPGFYEMLQHRFTRERENADCYEDVYHGDVYMDLEVPGGFLSNPNNITFMWYADGILIFKSSKFGIWAVYFIINELPYAERTKKENILLVTLWFGDSKPNANLFLDPLIESVQAVRDGIDVHLPNAAHPIIVQGMVIIGTCDLPAKALMENMKQFNGHNGCQICTQEGLYLTNAKVMVYPYEPFTLRTDEETLLYAHEAYHTKSPVCGVKGPTVLTSIVHQNMRALAVDIMHCGFEGAAKSLLNFWFSPKFCDHPSSIIEKLDLVERRLSSMTPPSSAHRTPRSIKSHLAYWKAHELKSWFFYFSMPCLSDVMEEEYFEHYKLLVLGVSLLCKSSVHPDSVELASRLLNEYVGRFEYLYGLRYMSNNLHQLLHLPNNVRKFGPLWTTSCFPLEDLNGKLKKLVHGSNAPQLQIHSAVSQYLNLTTLKSDKLVAGRPATTFCESLDYKCGRIKCHLINGSMYIAGKSDPRLPLLPDIARIFEAAGIPGRKYSYQKLLKEKMMFTSTQYAGSTRTDSTYAAYVSDGLKQIGRIKCFARVVNCACQNLCYCVAQDYAIVKRCLCNNPFSACIDNTPLSTVHKLLNFADEEQLVNVNDLISVCYYCEIQDTRTSYIIEPINLVEWE